MNSEPCVSCIARKEAMLFWKLVTLHACLCLFDYLAFCSTTSLSYFLQPPPFRWLYWSGSCHVGKQTRLQGCSIMKELAICVHCCGFFLKLDCFKRLSSHKGVGYSGWDLMPHISFDALRSCVWISHTQECQVMDLNMSNTDVVE